ncbi:MAG: Rpn family recombination-promoting nuclease/putative transposase [Candidatus Symbiodolus clandestinus]
MLAKLLDPKNDVAFQKIFGSEQHKTVLIHFINDILEFKGDKKIEQVEFLKTIQDPDIAIKKQSVVDVLCKDLRGTQYIIEMQVAKTRGFEQRAQFYAAKTYGRQANRGDGYHHLKEVIFIAIADYIIFPDKAAYKSDHVILDKVTYEHDLKDFSFTFIELPKFTKKPEDPLSNMLERWCCFFKHAPQISVADLKKLVDHPILEEAYQALDQHYWSETEYLAYENESKRIRDHKAMLDEAEYKGEQKGREQGRQERTFEIAKKLLATDMPMVQVKQLTQLSDEDIAKLQGN